MCIRDSFAGAGVEGDGVEAAVFGEAGELDADDLCVVPSHAELDSEGDGDCGADGAEDGLDEGEIAQQAGASVDVYKRQEDGGAELVGCGCDCGVEDGDSGSGGEAGCPVFDGAEDRCGRVGDGGAERRGEWAEAVVAGDAAALYRLSLIHIS